MAFATHILIPTDFSDASHLAIDAGGMLATARLTGQTVGAALAALVMARLGVTGGDWALAMAACFAALAATVSLARIRAFRTHTPAE